MIYNPIEFIWKDVFVWEISDDQINGNHASVGEILQVTILSVCSVPGDKELSDMETSVSQWSLLTPVYGSPA